MTENQRSVEAMLSQYRDIIRKFVNDEMTAEDFEAKYLHTFANDKIQMRGDVFVILADLFFDVDDYVSDPVLRDSPGDLSGEQLRERAAATYEKLFESE